MKLNATTEMEPVTWPEFGRLHPFAPAEQAAGYRDADRATSSAWLCEITGYDAVSLQPNAGSQGELAGLLAIRGLPPRQRRRRPRRVPHPVVGPRHQRGVGGDGRHAGRRRGAATDHGNVDLDDLAGQARRARRRRSSALMVTYPSTHGVFEERDRRHLRRRARRRRPGVRRRRQPQRPGRPGPARAASAPTSATSTSTRRSASPTAAAAPASGRWRCARTWRRTCPTTRSSPTPGRPPASGPISAAPWGSAGILPIPWAYIRMMGPDGLTPGDPGGDPQRQLRGPPARRPLPGALHGPGRAGRPRVHPRPAARSRRRPASPSTTSPSGSSTTASTPRR